MRTREQEESRRWSTCRRSARSSWSSSSGCASSPWESVASTLFHGNGFDFVGLRNWEAGDRFENIDWAQSSLTNFAPLVIRDFEQPSTAGVVVVADHSRSTRCGVDALPEGTVGPAAARGNRAIAHAVARAIATIGMSAVSARTPSGWSPSRAASSSCRRSARASARTK